MLGQELTSMLGARTHKYIEYIHIIYLQARMPAQTSNRQFYQLFAVKVITSGTEVTQIPFLSPGGFTVVHSAV